MDLGYKGTAPSPSNSPAEGLQAGGKVSFDDNNTLYRKYDVLICGENSYDLLCPRACMRPRGKDSWWYMLLNEEELKTGSYCIIYIDLLYCTFKLQIKRCVPKLK